MKNKNLVLINTNILNDATLSWTAKGLAVYFDCHVENDLITTEVLNQIPKAKDTKIGLEELIEKGYIEVIDHVE
jgi:hypothetical protein